MRGEARGVDAAARLSNSERLLLLPQLFVQAWPISNFRQKRGRREERSKWLDRPATLRSPRVREEADLG